MTKNGVVGKIWGDVRKSWEAYAPEVEGFAIKNCGHFVPEEQPAVVEKELRRWIEKAEV